MLKKSERLTTAAFNTYFKTGKRLHGKYVQVIYTAGVPFHGAVVVGKKVYTRAVDRNRLRRRLYAVLYKKREQLAGVCLVTVKPLARQVPYREVLAELEALLADLAIKQVQ